MAIIEWGSDFRRLCCNSTVAEEFLTQGKIKELKSNQAEVPVSGGMPPEAKNVVLNIPTRA